MPRLLPLLALLLLCSCSEILFEEIMPRSAAVQEDFPPALYGTWNLPDSTDLHNTCLEFIKNPIGQTEVYSYIRMHRDSVATFVERQFGEQDYRYTLSDSMLDIAHGDTHTKIMLQEVAPNYLHLNRQILLVFDFKTQKYRDMELMHTLDMHLRKQGDRYYLNLLTESQQWNLFSFTIADDEIKLQGSTILHEGLSSNIAPLTEHTEVNIITKPHKLARFVVSINPSDETLQNILTDQRIMSTLSLRRMAGPKEDFPLWAMGLIGLALLIAVPLLVNKRT